MIQHYNPPYEQRFLSSMAFSIFQVVRVACQSCSRLQNSRVFFSKSVKKFGKRGVRVFRAQGALASHARSVSPQSRSLFSASFQTFCLTSRAYLNTQKYGLFCSLVMQLVCLHPKRKHCQLSNTFTCYQQGGLGPFMANTGYNNISHE